MGTLPCRTTVTNRDRAEMRPWAPLLVMGPVKSLRCCGLSPSGPPAESLGKDLMARMISSSDTVMGGSPVVSAKGMIEEARLGWGCFC